VPSVEMQAAATGQSDAADILSRAIARHGADAMFIGAHPDDETFAMGGHLAGLPLMRIVIVTDGAPRDLRDAQKVGFSNAQEYANARAHEMRDALVEAGVNPDGLIMLGIPDKETAFQLVSISHQFVDILAEYHPRVVFTHSYEGGHPDHDAVAFAMHAAAAILPRRAVQQPLILEMPYYRGEPDGTVIQSFTSALPPAHVVDLDDAAFEHKNRIMSRHESQRRLFGGTGFRSRREQFRVAPHYDFREPPNGGLVLYEKWQLGITGPEWMEQARQALETLELEP
jgi:N-acetylglucosamine malate deacetylase 2